MFDHFQFALIHALAIANTSSNNTREDSTHGHHLMVNTEIRLIIFWYDLNQIPYDYTVEVRNRFKGLDLIECLMNYGMKFVTL